MTLNFLASCLYLLNAGIVGMCHNTVHAVLGVKSRVVSRVVGKHSTKPWLSIALASGLKTISLLYGVFLPVCMSVYHSMQGPLKKRHGSPRNQR